MEDVSNVISAYTRTDGSVHELICGSPSLFLAWSADEVAYLSLHHGREFQGSGQASRSDCL